MARRLGFDPVMNGTVSEQRKAAQAAPAREKPARKKAKAKRT